jgi:hypothetical protein
MKSCCIHIAGAPRFGKAAGQPISQPRRLLLEDDARLYAPNVN